MKLGDSVCGKKDDDNNKQDHGRGNDYEASKLQGKIGDAFVTTCLFV